MIADISYDTIFVALIAAVVAPSVLFLQSERRHKIERAEMKADAAEAKAAAEAVAMQAAEAARLLAERQDAEEARQRAVAEQAAEAAKLLLESNHRVAARSEAMAEQLDTVAQQGHRIEVNTDGALTKSMRGTLAAVETGLAALRTLAAERTDHGAAATDETTRAITAGEAEAAALRAEINLRAQAIPTGET
jgi:hypothetical protein